MEIQGTRIAKTILHRNKIGGHKLPNFKTYYKATVIKILQSWIKQKKNSFNLNENPEIYPHIYSQLISQSVPR